MIPLAAAFWLAALGWLVSPWLSLGAAVCFTLLVLALFVEPE